MTNEYFLNQIYKKTLLIKKVPYLKYVLLFIFDNAANYSIYAKDVHQVININKRLGSQQVFLQSRLYIIFNKNIIV